MRREFPKKWSCVPRHRSLYRDLMLMRSLRLSVRTPGFQPGKRGSTPLGTAKALLSYKFTSVDVVTLDSFDFMRK